MVLPRSLRAPRVAGVCVQRRPEPRAASRCLVVLALLGVALALPGCQGGSSGNPRNRGDFKVALMSNGHGQIYPYRIRKADRFGNPTAEVINIESEEALRLNATSTNPVLPVAIYPETPVLPGGIPGNHFLEIRFTHDLDPTSILSDDPAAATSGSGLTTALTVLAYDPVTEQTAIAEGRGFVGGKTYVNRNGVRELVEAVGEDGGQLQVLVPEAQGFPRGFSNDVTLVQPNTFVFVADTDGDLSSFETFDPLGNDVVLRVFVSNAVRNSEGRVLELEACTATSVGNDPNPANVLGWSGTAPVHISPGNGETNVDPTTQIVVEFNKPVQPTDVGTFFDRANLTPQAGGVSLNVTIAAQTFSVGYYADPVSYADLCNYVITPLYNLPGDEDVQVALNRTAIRALKDNQPLGIDIATSFRTGRGPGIVNAPVSPDAIYVGIGGADPGVAVIDLNGYGQGTNGLEPDPVTGEPTLDPLDTHFATNPNIGQPGLTPSLAPGKSPLDAGSKGPLTLVEDTRGNTKLIGAPLLGQVGDIHVGAPLDLVFNNNNVNVNSSGANQFNPQSGLIQPGNPISISTHPNPPRLVFPPPNPSRSIFAEEPTAAGGPVNLLQPGTRSDFRARAVMGVFFGPAPPPPSPPPPPAYLPFASRQQIGHFLYVLDRENKQILVLNSNRFTVLDTIRQTDPYRLAMSPSLGLLAVSNFSSGSVTFIDIDPTSPTFHTQVAETEVPEGAGEIAWQPDGEVVCVVCSVANALAVISGADFSVLKVATGNIVDPLGIAVTQRYITTGNTSNLYYAYVLNSNGTVAVFESGPDGTNGIGFNDMIGLVQPRFPRPRAIKLDYTSSFGGIWVSHVDDQGVGVVSRCELTSSPQGPQPIQQQTGTGFQLPPTFRQKEWTITDTFGGSDPNQPLSLRFSGNTIADFVFDEMFNVGGLMNQLTNYSGTLGLSILGHSSKGAVIGGTFPYRPAFLFAAVSDVGKIDVVDVRTKVLITSIDVPGANLLSSYWRQ